MSQIKPHTLSGFMELLPQPQLQMEARIKVKTPGNLLYVNYHKLADRRKKEE